jgi:hypothetical protein
MIKPPVLLKNERQNKIADILRRCLQSHGLQHVVNETELVVGELSVTEKTSNHDVSLAVLDTMFPHQTAPCDLYHYTSLESLKSIASSGQLRLYAVRKRINQGELDAFAKAHGLKGYLDGTHGAPFYEELSDDLFYTSLTRLVPPKNPSLMWGVFAARTGVRLQFTIAPKPAAELRPIYYEDSKTSLLNEINKELAREALPIFVPWTLSRIGVFYLPLMLRTEDEVRLAIKRYKGGPNPVLSDGEFNYWPLPIGVDNDFCRVDCVGIHAAPSAVRTDVEAAVAGTPFALPLTGP